VTSVQKWAADVLDAALNGEPEQPKDYIVRGYDWAPDGAETGKTYVSVIRTLTEPAPNAQGARRHELTISVMTSLTDPERADEALDEAFRAVLGVIDTDPDFGGLTWLRADRTVNGNQQYPGMAITATCYTPKETP
jgi:hypothetical protein